MPAQAYGIPVIFQDLRQEEALLQMFDSLEMLEKTMNDVYEKVANRVKVEVDRVSRVKLRLAVAKEKLTIIKGNENATTVFSPAKYPAPRVLEDFVPMYNSIHPLSRIVHPDYDLDDDEQTVSRGPRRPQEDFDFLRRLTNHEREAEAKRGLGRLPSFLPTVSSLLLFNSAENPYKEFRLLDNTIGTEGPEKVDDLPKGPKGTGLLSGGLDDLTRDRVAAPKWGTEAPALQAPTNLEGIGPIAHHNWEHVDLPSIAPSFEASQLLALPPPPSVGALAEGGAPAADLPVPAPPPAANTAAVPTPPPAPTPQPPQPAAAQVPVPPPVPTPTPPVPTPTAVVAEPAPAAAPAPPEEPAAPAKPAGAPDFLSEIRNFKKVALKPKSEDSPKEKGQGMDMMARIMARGKMMKGESNGSIVKPDDKIMMPGMDKKPAPAPAAEKSPALQPKPAPTPKRAPPPEPEVSINDMVLFRRKQMESDTESGSWSDSGGD